MAKVIEALLAAMTLEEKIGQLTMAEGSGHGTTRDVQSAIREGRLGSLLNVHGSEIVRELQRLAIEETRLEIPLLFGLDVLHGHRTIFPIPLAEAAAFDPPLWEATARAAAAEASRDGIMLTFAPMLDLARDPRWGRIAESPGEDPLLGSRFASAKVRGFQGRSLSDPTSLAATAKHIGAYGAVTAGREYASGDLSERTLLELHLPAFKAAADAGVAAIMAAFTDIAGVPAHANVTLLRKTLRCAWGFEGVVISDYGAVAELVPHGVAADLAEAAALALTAGIDIDMMGDAYRRGLPAALARGLVGLEAVDAAVMRVLRLKERLGLFDEPYRGLSRDAPADDGLGRDLAREAARRSIVLLTNDGVLPLPPGLRRIAVVGPLADAARAMLGPWAAIGEGTDATTIADGLRLALPDCVVDVSAGVSIAGSDTHGIADACRIAETADIVVLCLGEDETMSGEAGSRAHPELPGAQRILAEAILDLGKPVVALIASGRPLIVPWLVERASAVLATWFLGQEAGHAIADVLIGAANPSGRLPVSWPRDVGQIPIFYAERPTGRPEIAANRFTSKYLDVPATPQFPFGHGLSYSRFVLSGLRSTTTEIRRGQHIEIAVDVTNEGPVAGEETVLFFIHDPVASVARPLLELKDFAKIRLRPGERGTVTFTLTSEAFIFAGRSLAPVLEVGEIELFVGKSADRGSLLRTSIRVIVAQDRLADQPVSVRSDPV
ncbi:glycoside hydrolase family 3 N-terminal domain-containing protein [Bosea psychrotolerans]|uniref:beta-glucosidase n=1 Tax=Bosea psychrotolerans TaxID=1871628 RepID=A0A2S4MD61_9HYPH|nr:glycoside hydrolase family 3 N-terminal domain-containing protein [Bosea psychrotolerans]POR52559.1 beta-glucosidase [Bosea psychrotolerans]